MSSNNMKDNSQTATPSHEEKGDLPSQRKEQAISINDESKTFGRESLIAKTLVGLGMKTIKGDQNDDILSEIVETPKNKASQQPQNKMEVLNQNKDIEILSKPNSEVENIFGETDEDNYKFFLSKFLSLDSNLSKQSTLFNLKDLAKPIKQANVDGKLHTQDQTGQQNSPRPTPGRSLEALKQRDKKIELTSSGKYNNNIPKLSNFKYQNKKDEGKINDLDKTAQFKGIPNLYQGGAKGIEVFKLIFSATLLCGILSIACFYIGDSRGYNNILSLIMYPLNGLLMQTMFIWIQRIEYNQKQEIIQKSKNTSLAFTRSKTYDNKQFQIGKFLRIYKSVIWQIIIFTILISLVYGVIVEKEIIVKIRKNKILENREVVIVQCILRCFLIFIMVLQNFVIIKIQRISQVNAAKRENTNFEDNQYLEKVYLEFEQGLTDLQNNIQSVMTGFAENANQQVIVSVPPLPSNNINTLPDGDFGGSAKKLIGKEENDKINDKCQSNNINLNAANKAIWMDQIKEVDEDVVIHLDESKNHQFDTPEEKHQQKEIPSENKKLPEGLEEFISQGNVVKINKTEQKVNMAKSNNNNNIQNQIINTNGSNLSYSTSSKNKKPKQLLSKKIELKMLEQKEQFQFWGKVRASDIKQIAIMQSKLALTAFFSFIFGVAIVANYTLNENEIGFYIVSLSFYLISNYFCFLKKDNSSQKNMQVVSNVKKGYVPHKFESGANQSSLICNKLMFIIVSIAYCTINFSLSQQIRQTWILMGIRLVLVLIYSLIVPQVFLFRLKKLNCLNLQKAYITKEKTPTPQILSPKGTKLNNLKFSLSKEDSNKISKDSTNNIQVIEVASIALNTLPNFTPKATPNTPKEAGQQVLLMSRTVRAIVSEVQQNHGNETSISKDQVMSNKIGSMNNQELFTKQQAQDSHFKIQSEINKALKCWLDNIQNSIIICVIEGIVKISFIIIAYVAHQDKLTHFMSLLINGYIDHNGNYNNVYLVFLVEIISLFIMISISIIIFKSQTHRYIEKKSIQQQGQYDIAKFFFDTVNIEGIGLFASYAFSWHTISILYNN